MPILTYQAETVLPSPADITPVPQGWHAEGSPAAPGDRYRQYRNRRGREETVDTFVLPPFPQGWSDDPPKQYRPRRRLIEDATPIEVFPLVNLLTGSAGPGSRLVVYMPRRPRGQDQAVESFVPPPLPISAWDDEPKRRPTQARRRLTDEWLPVFTSTTPFVVINFVAGDERPRRSNQLRRRPEDPAELFPGILVTWGWADEVVRRVRPLLPRREDTSHLLTFIPFLLPSGWEAWNARPVSGRRYLPGDPDLLPPPILVYGWDDVEVTWRAVLQYAPEDTEFPWSSPIVYTATAYGWEEYKPARSVNRLYHANQDEGQLFPVAVLAVSGPFEVSAGQAGYAVAVAGQVREA